MRPREPSPRLPTTPRRRPWNSSSTTPAAPRIPMDGSVAGSWNANDNGRQANRTKHNTPTQPCPPTRGAGRLPREEMPDISFRSYKLPGDPCLGAGRLAAKRKKSDRPRSKSSRYRHRRRHGGFRHAFVRIRAAAWSRRLRFGANHDADRNRDRFWHRHRWTRRAGAGRGRRPAPRAQRRADDADRRRGRVQVRGGAGWCLRPADPQGRLRIADVARRRRVNQIDGVDVHPRCCSDNATAAHAQSSGRRSDARNPEGAGGRSDRDSERHAVRGVFWRRSNGLL